MRPASWWSRARDGSPTTCATLAADAGYEVLDIEQINGDAPDILIDAVTGRSPLEAEPTIDDPETLVLALCVDGSLAELDTRGGAVGFHALPPLAESRLVEMTRSSETRERDAGRAEAFFRSLGKHVEWVGDAPGLVLGRIVCQLVNEAAFACREGVGSPQDVDVAMRAGYNYPRGPLEWADEIELDHVLSTLDSLYEELKEERYRAAPLLRRMVAEGAIGEATGQRVLHLRRLRRRSPAGLTTVASPSDALHAGALGEVAVRDCLVAAAVGDARRGLDAEVRVVLGDVVLDREQPAVGVDAVVAVVVRRVAR